MSRTDRAIGIGLGLIIGFVALILFVFGGSGQSIDAPSLHHFQARRRSAGGDHPEVTRQGANPNELERIQNHRCRDRGRTRSRPLLRLQGRRRQRLDHAETTVADDARRPTADTTGDGGKPNDEAAVRRPEPTIPRSSRGGQPVGGIADLTFEQGRGRPVRRRVRHRRRGPRPRLRHRRGRRGRRHGGVRLPGRPRGGLRGRARTSSATQIAELTVNP